MSNQIEVKIQVIIHATEDSEKILKSFSDIFNIEQDKFKIQSLTGHFENPILVISLTIKKILAEKFMAKLFSKMKLELLMLSILGLLNILLLLTVQEQPQLLRLLLMGQLGH